MRIRLVVVLCEEMSIDVRNVIGDPRLPSARESTASRRNARLLPSRDAQSGADSSSSKEIHSK